MRHSPTMEIIKRWNGIYSRYQGHGGPPSLCLSILDQYCDPNRQYHNVNHIWHMVTLLDSYALEQSDHDRLFVAILFHDLVYDPTAKDNEERSAEVAIDKLSSCHFPADFTTEVESLIICTKTHEPDPVWPNSKVILDADLAILGESPDRYGSYANAIREEYAFVSDVDYREGRTKVLQSFLDREHIYLTELCQAQFEKRARENIANEIKSLNEESI